jgi:hypothetical protein
MCDPCRHQYCCDAANNNDLDAVKYLHATEGKPIDFDGGIDHPFYYSAVCFAAQGNIEGIEYCIQNGGAWGIPGGLNAASEAAYRGYKDCFEWCIRNGCPMNQYTFDRCLNSTACMRVLLSLHRVHRVHRAPRELFVLRSFQCAYLCNFKNIRCILEDYQVPIDTEACTMKCLVNALCETLMKGHKQRDKCLKSLALIIHVHPNFDVRRVAQHWYAKHLHMYEKFFILTPDLYPEYPKWRQFLRVFPFMHEAIMKLEERERNMRKQAAQIQHKHQVIEDVLTHCVCNFL